MTTHSKRVDEIFGRDITLPGFVGDALVCLDLMRERYAATGEEDYNEGAEILVEALEKVISPIERDELLEYAEVNLGHVCGWCAAGETDDCYG